MQTRLFSPLLVLVFSSIIWGDEPLHVRIDRLIEAAADGPVGPPANDADFLRRVYLDLAGRIPTLEETRGFLADTSADKRTKLVDKLLASDEYPRRMKELFHIVLMERRGTHEEWDKFLEKSFAANKPWDQLVREIANPNADDENTRGSAFFITQRLTKVGQNPTDYPGLARDFGRLFLGVDVQCAQCHDHLFIGDYKQVDFQGIFAYVGNATIRRDVQFPAVAENVMKKKLDFMSVFEMEPLQVGLRLPGGEEIEIPEFKRGEEYITPPDRKTRAPGVLKFSPLKVLGEQLPTVDNELFTKNIANRLWWAMMGRGLVHPLDLHHSDNAPSHPELLDLLAGEFAAHKFDIKWMLRELALTKTYARTSLLPDSGETIKPDSYRVALERPLGTEQILRSLLQATGETNRIMSREKKEGDEEAEPTFDEIYVEFKTALANLPREPEIEFNPTVKAALFLSNNELLLDWLEPREGNLVDRLSKVEDTKSIVGELYLTILSRQPTEVEQAEAIKYLGEKADQKSKAISNLAWSLVTSTEFAINH